jgi:hypothetical protein
MAKRTGAETTIGIAIAPTFGTAVAAGDEGKSYANSITPNRNVTVLRSNPIGGGRHLDSNDTQQGADDPTPQLVGDLHYNDSKNLTLAQFFGGASSVAWGTAFCHSLYYVQAANSWYTTLAAGVTSSEVMEYPSVATRGMTLATSTFPGPLVATFDLIADQRKITATTNTTATLDAATVADTKRIIVDQDDYFLINAQAGAGLTTSDKVSITSCSISYQKGQAHVPEIKGSAGHSTPVMNGDPPLKVTLTVGLRTLADFTYFTAAAAGTAYKAELRIQGVETTQAGVYYAASFFFPYLKILEDPAYSVSSAADNPYTVVFEALTTTSVPTGMLDIYPHVTLTNTRWRKYKNY